MPTRLNTMNPVVVFVLLYILDYSSSGEIEETTYRYQFVLSTEPTMVYYPSTEPGSARIRHIALRDIRDPLPSSSPRYTPQIPSYAPPARNGFFTPPLPPEYLNPFAGKPTLRGSNSEGPHGQRRPVPPPPPIPRIIPDRHDRVPLPPPDYSVPEVKPSGKKALNTPSRPNSHQTFESAFKDVLTSAKAENSNSRQGNDSDFDFVPILGYQGVERILSGSSGRKHDLLDGRGGSDRHSSTNSRHSHHNLEMTKKLPPFKELIQPAHQPPQPPPLPPPRPIEIPRPPPPPPVFNTTVPKNRTEIIPIVKVDDVIKKVVNETVTEEPVVTEREEEGAIADQEVSSGATGGGGARLWNLAWDVHVYLAATLFAVLAASALINLAIMRCRKLLLPRTCVICVLTLVAIVGVLRAVYLFHDAYNAGRSFPPAVAHLLLNVACPLITSAFGALFLFLTRAAEASVARPFGHPLCLLLVGLCHLALCVCVDVSTDLSVDTARWLPLLCQVVYIVLCVCLGTGYLVMYKSLSSAAARKQVEVFGSVYTTDVRRSRPAALGLVIRLGLAVAMLVLLMAVVQVAGAVAAPEEGGWLWWAYQSSVRVIELAVCSLLVWAAATRLPPEDEKGSTAANSTTGFALFPCAPCRQPDDHVDDIYPAVCSTNQAIHNYSLRTGKKLYDDAFPLNTLNTLERKNGSMSWNNYDEIGPGSEVVEVKDALTRTGLTTLPERRSGGMGGVGGGTLPDRRRRERDLSGSMLVDENGFVRFRSLAADDALRRATPGNKSLPRRVDPRDLR